MKKLYFLFLLMLLPLMASSQNVRAIHVETAGTLSTLISDEEKYNIDELILTGELNGTDFRLLRDMAGNNYLGELTEGKLKNLDISGVNLVRGGEMYLDTERIEGENAGKYLGEQGHLFIEYDNVLPKYLFAGCTLQSIKLPNGVVQLGDGLFLACSRLADVFVPEHVSSIGYSMFEFCKQLSSIIVDDNNTIYDSRNNCNAIIETSSNSLKYGCSNTFIPNTVTTIESYSFRGTALTSITIPESVNIIGIEPFLDCRYLTSIKVESSNPYYDSREDCNAIIQTSTNELVVGCQNSTIPTSVTSIGSYAFVSCNITSITIPNGVSSIGHYAFNGCSLQNVTIPDNVKSIGMGAFSVCDKLTHLIIGSGVQSIGDRAFGTCIQLKNVDCFAKNVPVSSDNIFDNSPIASITLSVPVNSVDLYKSAEPWGNFKEIMGMGESRIVNVETAGTLPSLISDEEKYNIEMLTLTGELNGTDIRLLRDMAGNNYKGEVTEGKLRILDLSGTRIVEGGDPYIESSSIKTTVGATMFPIYGSKYSTNKDVISYYMFAGCNSLQSIKLPAGITSIRFSGFAYCTNMESITILDKVTYLETAAFQDCRNLASIRIPKSVANIPGGSFSGCDNLNSIIVEEGNPKYDSRDNCNAVIETEDNSLIIGCSATTIPNTVTAIGMQAFYGCQFTSISIPSSVKTIEYGAFDASALTSLTIPSTVESIGIQIFRQCNQLTTIVVESGNPNYDSRENCNAIIETATNKLIATCSTTVVPSSVTALGEYTFTQWKEIPSNLLDNVKIICDNAFDNALFASIVIPEGVEIIGKEAFRNANLLESIELPISLTSIGDNAFSACSRLEKIISHQTDPIEISENVFGSKVWDSSTHQNVKLSSKATLYVPYGCKAAYLTADNWKEFKEILELDEMYSITLKNNKLAYCCDKNMDFSGREDVKAFVVTGYDYQGETSTIWLTRVKDVPAGTPIIVKGTAGTTYNIPIKASSSSYYENMLKGNTTGDAITLNPTEGDYMNMVMSGGQFWAFDSPISFPANMSYLQLPKPEAMPSATPGSSQTVNINNDKGKVTLCSTVDLDFSSLEGDGVKAFTVTGYDNGSSVIWMTRVTHVSAGVGLIVKGPKGEYSVPSSGAQTSYANMLVGNNSGSPVSLDPSDATYTHMVMSKGEFWSFDSSIQFPSGMAYLRIPKAALAMTRSAKDGTPLSSYSFTEEREVISMTIDTRSISGEGDTTGIREVKSEEVNSEKLANGEWYTLQGQRVTNPGKGLYIRNGKKVVIK